MNNSKTPTIEEILNFNFTEELDLDLLPQEEQEDFNANLYGSLLERIIKRTAENLNPDDQEKIMEMVGNEEKIENIFKFIKERNENFEEEIGEEFLNFKTEIYDLLKN